MEKLDFTLWYFEGRVPQEKWIQCAGLNSRIQTQWAQWVQLNDANSMSPRNLENLIASIAYGKAWFHPSLWRKFALISYMCCKKSVCMIALTGNVLQNKVCVRSGTHPLHRGIDVRDQSYEFCLREAFKGKPASPSKRKAIQLIAISSKCQRDNMTHQLFYPTVGLQVVHSSGWRFKADRFMIQKTFFTVEQFRVHF